jgi:hypothetical protein
MGVFTRTLDGGNAYKLDFLVTQAVVAGQVLISSSAVTDIGEVINPTVTAAADFFGCADVAVTFSATPTAEPIAFGHSPQNLVRLVVNPLAVWRFKLSGGATMDTALVAAGAASGSTGSHILVQDTASTTVITDVSVGTTTMQGGLIKGRTGNNVGAIRRMNAHTDNTSTTVSHAFINSFAVGDTGIRVPYSHSSKTMRLTTPDFSQADAITSEEGTGIAAAGVNVIIDEENDQAWVDVVSLDHCYNPA